ncbi:manganese transport system substrate-binding protein [Flavimobilis soli]|uniref:Manganese transport system substrate-binding protein n=1 Tax=Flavimobilis soli TaxID=442709 RepID=A0A2A9E8G0_9MICO|nr:metal ABC transporter substrate-binding protein [Flavimobilis soli]PFG35337.1 manganese transport system substrate-binding protein [Flavimobilis soli]PFG37840.1 manganese transport system substrate-binding protein [Flavimobilis soli]
MSNFWIRTFERAAAAALVSASLTACSGGPAAAPPAADDRLHVVTTFTVLADMVAEVGGARVRVESITKPGAEIHGYEPTPADLVRAQGADLVVDNGLGLEAWFAQLLADVDAPHVTVSDGVDPQPITSGEAAGHPNPHAWMSPTAGQTYVANIADALASADPEGEALYWANAAAYRAQLEQIADDLADAVAAVPEPARLLVTCEGAFSYLARDAGLREAYLWPVNAEQQATPRSTIAVVEAVRRDRPRAVFCESTVPDVAQRQVARETGTPLAGPLYVDSLSGPDGPVPSYLDLLRHTTTTIVAGLTAEDR